MGKTLVAGLVAIWLAAVGSGPAAAATKVFMMRGLADVSTGLDDLAVKLRKRGVAAVVASYTDVASLTETALRESRTGVACPLVIIGHSLGADAAITMARSLERSGVAVALIVAFSPAHSDTVPTNVTRLTSYYQSNSFWNHTYGKGPGFKGTLRNVNLARDDRIDHFNIEKNAKLHAETIRAIQGLPGTCGGPKAADIETSARK